MEESALSTGESLLRAGAVATGGATVLLAAALAFVLLKVRSGSSGSSYDDDAQQQIDAAEEEQEDDAVDESKYPGGVVTVYYATQTGTAESFARELEREGPDRGFRVRTVDLEDVGTDLTKLLVGVDKTTSNNGAATKTTARAVILAATYGEGEPTDNAMAFVQALKDATGEGDDGSAAADGIKSVVEDQTNGDDDRNRNRSLLSGLDYCVFGLGNKQYDHYNAMGKFFDGRLERLGANRVAAIGLGDDDSDLENDFEAWRETVLWPTLRERYLPDNADATAAASSAASTTKKSATATNKLPDCQYAITYHNKDDIESENDLPPDQVHGPSRHYFTAVDCPVTVVRELRRAPADTESTVHVEIDISQAPAAKGQHRLAYETADNLGVLPLNDAAVVGAVAAALGYDLDAAFSLEAAPHHDWHGAPFPMPLTVRECLTRYCDLTSAPLRSDLKLLAAYATDPTDQKALLRMATKEGKAEYKEKIVEAHVGLVDLLKRCPSIKIPLEHLLANCCALLQTRFYTISSSSSVHPDSIHLTVAVTKSQRKDGTAFNGVCSSHMARCAPGSSTLRVFVRPSTFRLPTDPARPIIMIGPGTGIAPMRALLQERAHQRLTKESKVGPNVLYFGCRKASQDYLYEDELRSFQESGDLAELHLAFSRDQSEKEYVQHLLRRNAEDTWRSIEAEGAYVYVCGGVKMGHDVSDALREIFRAEGNLSVDDAKAYLARLTSEGRYVQELWS